jgi:hypothetical protein
MLEVDLRPETDSNAGALWEITEIAFGKACEAGGVEKVRG